MMMHRWLSGVGAGRFNCVWVNGQDWYFDEIPQEIMTTED